MKNAVIVSAKRRRILKTRLLFSYYIYYTCLPSVCNASVSVRSRSDVSGSLGYVSNSWSSCCYCCCQHNGPMW